MPPEPPSSHSQSQVEIRDLILRHRRPTIAVLYGEVSGSILSILAVDTMFGESSLSISGGRARNYLAQEAANAGTIDGLIEPLRDDLISTAIDVAIRLSPARLYERRLRSIERRGSESSESSETSALELMDLREMQTNFRRSVDDLRQRLEDRDFAMPSFSGLPGKPHMPHLHLPKIQLSRPDLVEMRDKWVARRKAASDDTE